MDALNSSATTAGDYLGGTASWRTDLFSSCGTLVTHAESIEIINSVGGKFTPELKSPDVAMVRHRHCDYCVCITDRGLMLGGLLLARKGRR